MRTNAFNMLPKNGRKKFTIGYYRKNLRQKMATTAIKKKSRDCGIIRIWWKSVMPLKKIKNKK